MISKLIANVFFVVISLPSFAQWQNDPSGKILQKIKNLEVFGSVLYVAAHPDDENTRLLSYFAQEKGYRTGYLSLTRGDGGQNLIGKEQGELLGVLRTQELLAARRIDGAEQFFSRAYDFGYSKTPEETFELWGKEKILSDVVWVIRNFKPDVIITRFPTTGEGGHGHHTASAILAGEAFEAAADPKKFPEQLRYVQVWQAKRLFWNTFNFGTTNTTAEDQLQFDVGAYNPLTGLSIGEIAAKSRTNHKSQGFGSSGSRGSQIEYLKYIKGWKANKTPFDSISTTINRAGLNEKFEKQVKKIIELYDAAAPEKSIEQLLDARNLAESFKDDYWKNLKVKQLNVLIQMCAGLYVEAISAENSTSVQEKIKINFQVSKRLNTQIELKDIHLPMFDTTFNKVLETNKNLVFSTNYLINENVELSSPFWLKNNLDEGSFSITDQTLIGQAENKVGLSCEFIFLVNGKSLVINSPVVFRITDPVKGEIIKPLEILPAVTLNFEEKAFLITSKEEKEIRISLKSGKANISGEVKLNAPKGYVISPTSSKFTIQKKGNEQQLMFKLKAEKDIIAAGKINAVAIVDGKNYDKSIKRIEYDHIPEQLILENAEAKIAKTNLTIAGKNIGYIKGAEDAIPEALKSLGYNVSTLNDELLTNGNLSGYDAIVAGIRAFNTNERIGFYHNNLMKYVENGGVFLVQYNTNNFIGSVKTEMGPFPIKLGRERVTDEKAVVTLLNENHPIFNFPNKINATDFEGWIQERSLYHATEWDKNYTPLISMNDKGEKANEGSLLVTDYGKGRFIYTGLSFFRELPAGVPGAYRLFVNLISK